MTSNRLLKVAVLTACTIPLLIAWLPGATTPVAPASDHKAVAATLFADGNVPCNGAVDLQERVGRVSLQPVADGVAFQVVLSGAAPSWDYYVELSLNGSCGASQQFRGFQTDSSGNGVFKGVYQAGAGSYALLVDVVSDPPTRVPPNPKHREIAPSDLVRVTVK